MTKSVTINNIEYYTYADLTDASVYNNAIVGSTWASKTAVEQSQYLVMATRKIDSFNYCGQKVSDTQELKFPRVMANGKTSDDEVLTQLCCQIATYYLTNGSSSDSGDFMSKIDKYQLADLHIQFKKDATLDLEGLNDLIEQALSDWLLNQGMQIWL